MSHCGRFTPSSFRSGSSFEHILGHISAVHNVISLQVHSILLLPISEDICLAFSVLSKSFRIFTKTPCHAGLLLLQVSAQPRHCIQFPDKEAPYSDSSSQCSTFRLTPRHSCHRHNRAGVYVLYKCVCH